jgi:hypothetical protein
MLDVDLRSAKLEVTGLKSVDDPKNPTLSSRSLGWGVHSISRQ